MMIENDEDITYSRGEERRLIVRIVLINWGRLRFISLSDIGWKNSKHKSQVFGKVGGPITAYYLTF